MTFFDQKGSQIDPEGAPKGPQGTPRGTQEPPRWPKRCSRGSPGGPTLQKPKENLGFSRVRRGGRVVPLDTHSNGRPPWGSTFSRRFSQVQALFRRTPLVDPHATPSGVGGLERPAAPAADPGKKNATCSAKFCLRFFSNIRFQSALLATATKAFYFEN